MKNLFRVLLVVLSASFVSACSSEEKTASAATATETVKECPCKKDANSAACAEAKKNCPCTKDANSAECKAAKEKMAAAGCTCTKDKNCGCLKDGTCTCKEGKDCGCKGTCKKTDAAAKPVPATTTK